MSNPQEPYVIVVGVDYSEGAELALEQAIELGSLRNAELHAIHVISQVPPPLPLECVIPPESATASIGGAANRLERHVASKVSSLHERRGMVTGQPQVLVHVRFSSPARDIAELAAELSADLIVLGTHGRRGFSRLVLGSVAEEVVRLAPCPVLVVRAKRSGASSAFHSAVPWVCHEDVRTQPGG